MLINLPQIIRSSLFDKHSKEISTTYDRLSKLDLAIDWALLHNPQKGTNISGNLYLWRNDSLYPEAYPNVLILYEYFPQENKIELIDIAVAT